METIVLKDLLNELGFYLKNIKKRKKKIFIINESIYVVIEIDFASDIDLRKTSRDPEYFARNCFDKVFLCV